MVRSGVQDSMRIEDQGDGTYRVFIDYSELKSEQAELIQPLLDRYLSNACCLADKKEVMPHTGYTTSVLLVGRRLAEKVQHAVLNQLAETTVETHERATTFTHMGGSAIGKQVIGTNIDKLTQKVIGRDAVITKAQLAHWQQQVEQQQASDHWHLPFSNESYYVDRAPISKAIRDHLCGTTGTASTASTLPVQTVVLSALHGLGGIGKTHIAIDYLTHARDYSFRCWFDASNLLADYRQRAIDSGLIHPGEKIDDDTVCRRVRRWFENHPGWLAVYDDVEDLANLKRYLPRQGGHVLITSRNQVAPWYTLGKAIPVDVMTEAEATALLERRMGKTDERCAELAKKLGYLPLALAQAGAYIRQTSGCDVSRYLDCYAEEQALLLRQNRLGEDELGQPHATVMTTWTMSFKAMEKAEHGEPAMALLQVCAYLASRIPDRLLMALLGLKNKKGDIELSNIKLLLRRYSFIDDREDKTITVHQLLQVVIRAQHQVDKWHWLRKASETIDADYWKDHEDLEDYQKVSLAPHFMQVKNHLEKIVADPRATQSAETRLAMKGVLATIVAHLGLLHGDLCQYREAKADQEQALAIEQSVYGESHPEVALTLGNLGLACDDLGEYREAKAYQAQALAIQQSVYGESHPAVARTLGLRGVS